MEQIDPEMEQLLRKAIFVHCKSKEDLHTWIQVYIGLDFPDTLVDPASTSSPMDLLWEIYNKAIHEEDPNFQRILAYASRDSFKTLGAAILEVLAVVHMERSVAHMAAIEQQARKAQSYVKEIFDRPILKDFVVGDNIRRVDFLRYYDPRSGDNFTEKQFVLLSPSQQMALQKKTNYIQVILCTMASTNCVDAATMITMADSSEKEALQVLPGEYVRSFDTVNRKWETTKVGSVSYSLKESVRVTFENGSFVVVSEDHPIFSRLGWIRARNLRLGLGCFKAGGSATVSSRLASWCFETDYDETYDPMSMVIGSLLGDASLTWPRSPSGVKYGCGPRFQVSHCAAQRDYLLLKQRLLSRLGIESKIWKDGNQFKLMTGVLPQFVDLYLLLYPDDIKTVTTEFLKKVGLQAVAFWFMDDGSGAANRIGERPDRALSFATCGFSVEENNLLKDRLAQLGWKVHIGKTNNGVKNYPVLMFDDVNKSRSFSASIDRFVIPCLRYKLATPSELLDTRCIDCGFPISVANGTGFSRCPIHHPHSLNFGRAERRKNKEYHTMFGLKVASIEFLGRRWLLDLHIDTEKEELRNFVANSSVLLHNSEHVPFFVVDEVDVIPKQHLRAYEEAKAIPCTRDGKLPITLLISTRKFSFGKVQQEIDEAATTVDDGSGLNVRHWNLIDVTERCPSTRHLPTEPQIPIYYSDDLLKSVSEEQYLKMDAEQKPKYKRDIGYAGCLKNCRLFAMCHGRLATGSKPWYRGSLLKPIADTVQKFRSASVPFALAQYLCRRPSAEGLIYPSLERDIHMIGAADMAHRITGEDYPETFSRENLIQLAQQREMKFVVGIDYGFTHNFAVVLLLIDGARAFVVGGWSQPELDPAQKIDLLDAKIKMFDPVIYADTEAPDMNKLLKKKGYRVKDWKKTPGSVLGGIEAVRYKLMPSVGDPELFFLQGDEGAEMFFTRMSKYHWAIDATGKPSDIPDDTDDDENDAIRYPIMNLFRVKGKLIASTDTPEKFPTVAAFSGGGSLPQGVYGQADWARKIIAEATQELPDEKSTDETNRGKSSGFNWSIE